MPSKIKVLNKYKASRGVYGIYIGRGSPLGNPFIIGKHGTRDEVIKSYEIYLKQKVEDGDSSIINALKAVSDLGKSYSGVNLICFCKPQKCHGDVIKKFVQDQYDK
jgi:hypothetical protein